MLGDSSAHGSNLNESRVKLCGVLLPPHIDSLRINHGCFVRDLDGHKIEAALWVESKAG